VPESGNDESDGSFSMQRKVKIHENACKSLGYKTRMACQTPFEIKTIEQIGHGHARGHFHDNLRKTQNSLTKGKRQHKLPVYANPIEELTHVTCPICN